MKPRDSFSREARLRNLKAMERDYSYSRLESKLYAALGQLHTFYEQPGGFDQKIDLKKIESLQRIHKDMAEVLENIRLHLNGINEDL